MLRDQAGRPITSLDQWPRPKRDYQWKPGRSAMEQARSWFRTGALACPEEIVQLLSSHPLTHGVEWVEGCPEFVTPLPRLSACR